MNVLCFPGSGRYEVDEIIDHHVALSNIYLVEKNPAVKAIFTRRARTGLLPPPENFLRMWLSEAVHHLHQRRVLLDVAHLDFCQNCTSDELQSELLAFIKSRILKDGGLLAVTVLAGREHEIDEVRGTGWSFEVVDFHGRPQPHSSFRMLSLGDQGRFARLWRILGGSMILRQFGKYQNTRTNNPMLWGIFEIHYEPIT